LTVFDADTSYSWRDVSTAGSPQEGNGAGNYLDMSIISQTACGVSDVAQPSDEEASEKPTAASADTQTTGVAIYTVFHKRDPFLFFL